ncbi:MAG: UDP-3-O-(3-hydroxymyristoyl)glucosamine N-acyltransferase [Candidatus Kapaibacterium sp.]
MTQRTAIPIGRIADLVQGDVFGDEELEVWDIQGLEDAELGHLSFLSNPKYARFVNITRASALIVGKDYRFDRNDLTYIVVDDPYLAFIKALRLLRPDHEEFEPGVDERAVIAEGVVIEDGVTIGPNVIVGSGCIIGSGSVILGNSFLGRNVRIGSGCRIYPNVTIYSGTTIASGVVIHSGSVIGSDGFGFTRNASGEWEKIPQTGSVVIEADVEIGAGVTIDRGTLGETRVGRGSKLDNLIHIAHNVKIGERTVIAAQTGISGSTIIGPENMIAGQVGIVGHIETAEHVIIEAQSGVSKSLLKSGRYFGNPAKEHSLALRQEGALRQLPNLLPELREMKRRIRGLEEALGLIEVEEETE